MHAHVKVERAREPCTRGARGRTRPEFEYRTGIPPSSVGSRNRVSASAALSTTMFLIRVNLQTVRGTYVSRLEDITIFWKGGGNGRPTPAVADGILNLHMPTLIVQWGWVGGIVQGLSLQRTESFFNIKKAFDSVPHQRLLQKLVDMNLDPFLIAWISDYLTGMKQRTVLNGSISRSLPVISGVPQGSVLTVYHFHE